MKCDSCPAYKEENGIYICVADVPDEEVKTFKDGKCGCKYKEHSVKEMMQARGIAVEEVEQLDFMSFLSGDASSAEKARPAEEAPVEEAPVEQAAELEPKDKTESAAFAEQVAEPEPVEKKTELVRDELSWKDMMPLDKKSRKRQRFRPGQKVRIAFSNEEYTVKRQSEDGISVYIEGKTAGTQVVAAADIISSDM